MKWLLTDEYGLVNLDWFSQIHVFRGKLMLICPDGKLEIKTAAPNALLYDISEFISSDESVLNLLKE